MQKERYFKKAQYKLFWRIVLTNIYLKGGLTI